MELSNYYYRWQLVNIYHRLFSLMVRLYRAGYQIALEDEWKDLKYSDGSPMQLPFEMDYLETVEDEKVQMIVKMIRIVDEGYSNIRFANNLSEKELYGIESSDKEDQDDEDPEDEDFDEDLEIDDDLEPLEGEVSVEEPYKDGNSKTNPFSEAFALIPFLYCDAVLLSGKNYDSEMTEIFQENYWNGTIKLQSEDFNVHFIIDIVNRLMTTITGVIDDYRDGLDR